MYPTSPLGDRWFRSCFFQQRRFTPPRTFSPGPKPHPLRIASASFSRPRCSLKSCLAAAKLTPSTQNPRSSQRRSVFALVFYFIFVICSTPPWARPPLREYSPNGLPAHPIPLWSQTESHNSTIWAIFGPICTFFFLPKPPPTQQWAGGVSRSE